MRSAVLFFFIVLAAFAYCQTPPVHAICDMPGTWSGTLSQILMFDSVQGYETNYGEIYIDDQKQQIRFDILAGKTNLGGSPVSYSDSIWQDFENKIEYILDRNTNICISQPLNLPFSGQLPSNSQYGGALLVGSQPVHEYFFPQTLANTTYQVEVGLMSGTCLPFNIEIYKMGSQPRMVMTEAVFNAVPMIPPFVMEIPSQCTSSSLFVGEVPEKFAKIRQALALHSLAFE
mmetsp:Transcript_115629/g.172801  ORF Transcript_115629/g.172801 Transcript_115629/m.172801 type:complete len:231 (+) Transcript_115629:56-748(+)